MLNVLCVAAASSALAAAPTRAKDLAPKNVFDRIWFETNFWRQKFCSIAPLIG